MTSHQTAHRPTFGLVQATAASIAAVGRRCIDRACARSKARKAIAELQALDDRTLSDCRLVRSALTHWADFNTAGCALHWRTDQ